MDVDVGRGLTLHVTRSGAGTPILLLHGFTGSAATWDALREVLDRRYTTIAVDLPGHGRSTAPADPARFALRGFADDLGRVLDEIGVERAGVVGYSMGGRAALQFALHHPSRVAALVLESATPGIETAAERAVRVDSDMALADMVERDGVPAFVQFWERLPIWSSQRALSAEVRATLHAQRLANHSVGLANSLRGAGAGALPPVWSQLKTIAAPTLLVAGALDAKFVAIAERMACEMPLAHSEIVRDAGHAVHLERPAEFAAIAAAAFEQMVRAP